MKATIRSKLKALRLFIAPPAECGGSRQGLPGKLSRFWIHCQDFRWGLGKSARSQMQWLFARPVRRWRRSQGACVAGSWGAPTTVWELRADLKNFDPHSQVVVGDRESGFARILVCPEAAVELDAIAVVPDHRRPKGDVPAPKEGEWAIQLEAPRGNGGIRRRVFVVLDREAEIVAAVDDGGNGWAALPLAGFEDCPRSPIFHISTAQYERYLRQWGPTSREAILSKARAICESWSIPLTAAATGRCFDAPEHDLEFAAALWHVWNEQPDPIRVEGPSGFIGQFGPYLLREDEGGGIALEERESTAAASRRLSELAALPQAGATPSPVPPIEVELTRKSPGEIRRRVERLRHFDGPPSQERR